MARKTILVDDLDGREADETVQFGIDGITYEVELCAENAQRLRDAVEPFAAVARKVADAGVQPPPPPSARKGPAKTMKEAMSRREQLDAIRAWARAQGFDIADRGRIPITVQQAFERAHANGEVSVV